MKVRITHLFIKVLTPTRIAHGFFESHKTDFVDQYPMDMQQLCTITEPHHVQENATAVLFRENKYTIMMSSYAFDLLLSFLQDNKMMTMLKFVNQYLNVKGIRDYDYDCYINVNTIVYSTKPLQKLKESQEQTSIGITGHTSKELTSMNQLEIFNGPTGYDGAFLELLEKKVKLEDEKAEARFNLNRSLTLMFHF